MDYDEMQGLLTPLEKQLKLIESQMDGIRKAYACSLVPFKKGDRVNVTTDRRTGTVLSVSYWSSHEAMVTVALDKTDRIDNCCFLATTSSNVRLMENGVTIT